jgi:putative transcriptional regulator
LRDWLRKIRDEKRLTQEHVAQASGIRRASYTMIENGVRNPSVEVAKRIAFILDFDWTIFFDSQCNKTTPAECLPTGTETL